MSIKRPCSENKLCRFAIPYQSGEKVGATKFRGDSYPDKGQAKFCSFRGETNVTREGDGKTKTIRWSIDGGDDWFGVLYKGPWEIDRPEFRLLFMIRVTFLKFYKPVQI